MMVPLRVDSPAVETFSPRPRLVLHDVSHDKPTMRRARKPSAMRRWENRFFSFAVAAVVIFLVTAFAQSLWHVAQVSDNGRFSSSRPAVIVSVRPGDTLWKFASRYGAPNAYILDRIETIARDNHLSPDAPLIPGQRLRVAVENPVELAKLSRQHRLSVASATRE